MNTVCTVPLVRQRGLSIVELMVGIAVGLFVVAAASTLVATQLSDNRRLMLETQVHQDLRAAADIITREVRRSGYWNAAPTQLAVPGVVQQNILNPFSAVLPLAGTDTQVLYKYVRAVAAPTDFGFRLEGVSVGAIKSFFSPSTWQSLTDEQAVNITEFSVTPTNPPAVRLACPNLCGGGDTGCWPTIAVRELEIRITGAALSDPQVKRTVTSRARLRNEAVVANVPGLGPLDRIACP